MIPGLIRRFHEAKGKDLPEVMIWGTDTPIREFLYVDDMAAASVFVMELDKASYDQYIEAMQSHINVGFGSDITIKGLAETIGQVIAYQGKITFGTTKPDGTPRKLMNSHRLTKMGWKAKVDLVEGLKLAYQDFLKQTNRL